MAKQWICTICGYIAEGETAPEKCPQCGAPQSKFKEMNADELLQFVTEHEIGVAKGTDPEMIKDLNTHFMGECTEVGLTNQLFYTKHQVLLFIDFITLYPTLHIFLIYVP